MSRTTGTLPESKALASEPVRGLSFTGTLRGEFQKVIGMRATWVLVLLGIAGFAGIMLLLTLGTPLAVDMMKAPKVGLSFLEPPLYAVFTMGSGIFMLLTGARLVGMEYSQGTLRILLGRGTGRVPLLVAKLLVLFGIGLALLIGFLVASVVWVGLATLHWTGSLHPLIGAASGAAKDLGVLVLLMILSLFGTIVVGTTAATIGRSVAFGVGAAMVLFPADNFATLMLLLVSEATKQNFWVNLSAYLLGPSLNVLPSLATSNRHIHILPPPDVTVTLTHALTVVGVWTLGLLLIELVLAWRRDVLA